MLLCAEWIFRVCSVLRKTAGSVRFRFSFEKPLVRFSLLCRPVAKYKKKRVSCLSCVCIYHFGRWFSKCSVGLKTHVFKV